MRQRLVFLALLGLVMLSCFPVMAQGAGETNAYAETFASLAAIVAAVPVVTELLKGFFPKLPPIAVQVLSWVVGAALCMFGWWQELGFLAGQQWYIALLYGLGSGLCANGIADTGLVDWLIGLFKNKKK